MNTAPVRDYTFSTDVRVRFADTDAQGIAHNASYFVWFEVGRVEYLREYAGGYQALRARGIEAEKQAFAAAFQSEDAQEGISAFLGKRQAKFRGK